MEKKRRADGIIAKPMYHDAELYDLKYAEKVEDITYYLRNLRDRGENILELMCGTGRIAIPLAQYGNIVTGIDNSYTMLAYAHKKIGQTFLKNIWLYEYDCRDFDLGRKFSSVILPLNSLRIY